MLSFYLPVGLAVADSDRWASLSARARAKIIDALNEAQEAGQNAVLEAEEETRQILAEQFGFSVQPAGVDHPLMIKPAGWSWIEEAGSAGDAAYELLGQILNEEQGIRGQLRREKRGEFNLDADPSGPVFFVTDRDDEADPELFYRFGLRQADTDNLYCGKILYSNRGGRRVGELHRGLIELDGPVLEGASECAGLIQGHSRPDESIVMIVHGYWNSFEATLKRGIALALDLELSSPVIVWSWPSMGLPSEYRYDVESVEWTKPHFEDFVRRLVEALEVGALDVVMHSMGARLGISILEMNEEGLRDKIRTLVFVAPDVADSIFRQRVRLASWRPQNQTLYAAEADRALQASEIYNSERRAGIGGQDIIVVRGVESIDVSPLERPFRTNHAHAFQVPEAVTDLSMLLRERLSAPERGLRTSDKEGIHYWFIDPRN